MSRVLRPLWSCPKCGSKLAGRNMAHSCGRYRLADHFEGKPPIVRRTFQAWVRAAREIGPVLVRAQKTRIVLMVRVRFAGAIVRSRWVQATLWLTRQASHPRLLGIDTYAPGCHVHRFRLERPEDVDADLRALLRESYAIGRQLHLAGK